MPIREHYKVIKYSSNQEAGSDLDPSSLTGVVRSNYKFKEFVFDWLLGRKGLTLHFVLSTIIK